MAVFDPKSRYVKHARVYHSIDRRGRTVAAVTPAVLPAQNRLGIHRRKQGQRLDHLAAFYLQDPYGYWRIVALNGVLLPDAAASLDLIEIPTVF